MLLIWIILFSILGSVGVIITVSIFLGFKEKTQRILIPSLISYATGTLLASAFLGMIPKAISYIDPLHALMFVLCGLIVFFVLEKLVIWRHCHNSSCDVHEATGPILLIGDAFHNFIDGIVIAASFLISFPMGIAISLAVIAHEIPQEVGDFAILLESGYSKRKALILNLLSSISTIPAAIIGYFLLDFLNSLIPIFIAISAASFIYIALTDLSPELQHQKIGLRVSIRQICLLIAGILTIVLILSIKI